MKHFQFEMDWLAVCFFPDYSSEYSTWSRIRSSYKARNQLNYSNCV